MKLNAKQLRDIDLTQVQDKLKRVKRNPLYFILENVYDTYNIGGLFRLADALAVQKMYLCGEMEIPPNSRIAKASIGTYKVVPWEYKSSALEAINELKQIPNSKSQVSRNKYTKKNKDNQSYSITKNNTPYNSISVVAVEQDMRAVSYTSLDYRFPLALVFGNETYGVLPETLNAVDAIAEIPMWGINRSLNVIVSAAIVSYWAVSKMV